MCVQILEPALPLASERFNPVSNVFKSDCDQLAWPPLRLCEIDLRPEGAFRFVHQGQPDVPPFSGVYREIVPPEKLVFEAMGAIGRVILKETGGATLLTLSITCVSAAHLDQFLQIGVDAGTSQTLDNLVVYVGSMKRR